MLRAGRMRFGTNPPESLMFIEGPSGFCAGRRIAVRDFIFYGARCDSTRRTLGICSLKA
jgi:hypothetical protein